MENAAKALLIAGGILIAIVILTIAVYLYTLYSHQATSYKEIISETEIQKFNSNFDVYIGRKDVTAQEIVSVWNLTKEYDNSVRISGIAIDSPEDFLKANIDKTFECNGYEYDDTGKITMLKFTSK